MNFLSTVPEKTESAWKDFPRLTSMAKASGCGCKIEPAVLSKILGERETNAQQFNTLLVGNEANDDAAAFRLPSGELLLSTADFFTPLVDDPFEFGRIASTNAISDIYAMGGKPLMALGILGWPVEVLPAEMAAEVMRGAQAVCAAAGIPLAGGHSITNDVPFFGLSVNGLVAEANLKRNQGAKAGDVLFLTKPIGIGMLSAALKRGQLEAAGYEELIRVSSTLNSVGELFGSVQGVTAMTDVTGFGLLGHLLEMLGEDLGAELTLESLPVLEAALACIAQHILPDAAYKNWQAYSSRLIGDAQKIEAAFMLLSDPQSSGGLLVACDPQAVEELKAIVLAQNPTYPMVEIGVVTSSGKVELR